MMLAVSYYDVVFYGLNVYNYSHILKLLEEMLEIYYIFHRFLTMM